MHSITNRQQRKKSAATLYYLNTNTTTFFISSHTYHHNSLSSICPPDPWGVHWQHLRPLLVSPPHNHNTAHLVAAHTSYKMCVHTESLQDFQTIPYTPDRWTTSSSTLSVPAGLHCLNGHCRNVFCGSSVSSWLCAGYRGRTKGPDVLLEYGLGVRSFCYYVNDTLCWHTRDRYYVNNTAHTYTHVAGVLGALTVVFFLILSFYVILVVA